ncbi:hypothetical protein HZH68_017083 [Vespula germanica]|uniref:Odorant receptor n=1 Tax=Vespula germanica TaxID=30212 RepID=A0A834IZA2_VESGE|nr:hypothetical protein HZH68_017083 [Vespula germanica]
MKKIFYRINRDWDVLANKPELTILKKYADVSSFCTVTIAINFYLYVGFLIFPSLISNFQYIFGLINENELVIPVVIDYAKKNHMLYYIVLSFQYVVIVILCTVGIANYSMFIAVIQHACALFNIVEWRVNERFKKNLHNFDYINSSIELAEENKWIVDIIEYYTKAIEFMSQLFSFEVNKTEGLKNICYIIGSILLIYLYAYLGQKLINHSADVFLAFCQIPFYLLSLKTQKMLLILIMNSMRICNLSVVGVKEISHDMFASMKNILHRVKCDWNDLANKPELVILKKYAHLSRLCTVIIASTVKIT